MTLVAYLYSHPPLRYVGGEMMTYRLLSYAQEAGIETKAFCMQADQEYEYLGVRILPLGNSSMGFKRAASRHVVVTHPELHSRVRTAKRKIGIVHNLGAGTIAGLQGLKWDCIVSNSMSTSAGLKKIGIRDTEILYPPTYAHEDLGLSRSMVLVSNVSLEKGGRRLEQLAGYMSDTNFLAVQGGYGKQHQIPLSNVYTMGHGPLQIPMSLARIVLSMSSSETYGMVIAEATQGGIPVIASSIPAHREVLGQTGTLLSNKASTKVWAKKLYEILESERYYESRRAIALYRGKELDSRTNITKHKWLKLLSNLL